MNKDKLILTDGTIMELEAGASLASLSMICADKAAMVAAWDKLTPENLASVTVQNGDGLIVGNYIDMVLSEPHMTITELVDGRIKMGFGLRQKTEVELLEERVAAVENGQEVQDGAIVELAGIVGGEA